MKVVFSRIVYVLNEIVFPNSICLCKYFNVYYFILNYFKLSSVLGLYSHGNQINKLAPAESFHVSYKSSSIISPDQLPFDKFRLDVRVDKNWKERAGDTRDSGVTGGAELH